MMRELVRSIGCCLVLFVASGRCWGDGGVVRAIERDGRLQISVFTSPNPPVAGPVDISVLVQDGATGDPEGEAQVEIAITPRSRPHDVRRRPATSAAATNKLFCACLVELEPGWYDVLVICEAGDDRGEVRFALEVGAAPAQLATLWPWFTWPLAPVVLFGLHEYFARRRPR
jgi:hypothetical protein